MSNTGISPAAQTAIAVASALSALAWATAQFYLARAENQRANDAKELKLLELQKRAKDAEAWDHLSTRAILKAADPDLKAYFLKEREYALIVRDFQAITPETTVKNTIAMVQILNRLRGSPFFDDKYRPEYEALWVTLTSEPVKSELKDSPKELSVPCEELFKLFPEYAGQFKVAYKSCGDLNKVLGDVGLQDAIRALEVKLRN